MAKYFMEIRVDTDQATQIARDFYGFDGEIAPLPGELDFNFKLTCESQSWVMKISRPDVDPRYLEFQQDLLIHVGQSDLPLSAPEVVSNIEGNRISRIVDDHGRKRFVRLLTWVDGRIWSTVSPHSDELLGSLGNQAGCLTNALGDYDHEMAHRDFEWDVARMEWTLEYGHLFSGDQKQTIEHFQKRFAAHKETYRKFRSSVVHGDANDNNIIVSNDYQKPSVKAIIDYGDTIYTQTINDLAVTLAYAVMDKVDPLAAAAQVIRGYHQAFPLLEEELAALHTLVASRLVISVTKSAINRQKEPDNTYLLISEKAAWDVLERWILLDEAFSTCVFRDACGFAPVTQADRFWDWALEQSISIHDMLPSLPQKAAISTLDLSVGSKWLGNVSEFAAPERMKLKLSALYQNNPDTLFAGGYLEVRPFYSFTGWQREGNHGAEYATTHLGLDLWAEEQTPVHTPFAGRIHAINVAYRGRKNIATVILVHVIDSDNRFYTMYANLSAESVSKHRQYDYLPKGVQIGCFGNRPAKEGCPAHLHFQLILDVTLDKSITPKHVYPNEAPIWAHICPDPNLLFRLPQLAPNEIPDREKMLAQRGTHLGKSLSLSYDTPLRIVRGSGAHLIDITGRKYLDTVNNVAHVGHEHPRVVTVGQEQMAVLNTNTRYLHENITEFAAELLSTFPDELAVVHVVNSGSEANELAMRMARAVTGERDFITVESGYHGNTGGCIDISSYKFDGKGGEGAPEHTWVVPLPDAYRGLYQGKDTGSQYASHIQTQIEAVHSKGRGVAGFICESILSCGGQVELPEGYLKLAYRSVREAGGICISDEVQVGCGRVGSHYWGFQLHDVVPDIVTIGKPIGNGHPLAAVVCTREVATAFANGMEYFNTYGGNPVSCAIGLEVLRVVKDENLMDNALSVGTNLKADLLKLQEEYPIIGDVRGQGLFLGFELVDRDKQPASQESVYLANRMQSLGVLMSTDGIDNNVLKIKPPMVFSGDDALLLVRRLRTVLAESFMRRLV